MNLPFETLSAEETSQWNEIVQTAPEAARAHIEADVGDLEHPDINEARRLIALYHQTREYAQTGNTELGSSIIEKINE